MRAVQKRLNKPGNRANAEAVRAKWNRLLDARQDLEGFWHKLMQLGKHKELLKLEMHLLERELLATDQKEVMLSVMSQFVARAPGCCDEILDGFEVVPAKVPYIRWRDVDRMINMTLMRLHKLVITRDDDMHLDIVDQWDKDTEDMDIVSAWEERAKSWSLGKEVLEKAKEWKQSVEEDVIATELLLRDFVGYVYVVQANRLITYHQAALLEEEVLEEEKEAERKLQKKKAKRQQRKQNSKDPGQDTEAAEGATRPDELAADKADPEIAMKQEGGLQNSWTAYERARRQVLAERVVKRQKQLEALSKPKNKLGDMPPEEEESAIDEWQTFEDVLSEIKKEIAAYKGQT
mmetsp:Transcript_7575/g.12009  ORF Transcript_7575/g.12009 Transcript_7575/m.12009 type:complete len:348 (-) Transcript_7575:123-1166(-)|eukprot:CAMPEP_0184308100 /NCGR_PEP_ID=MMETSP1049-20130417/16646_1 /TAXON_ID=77928 /ORGANISM="Proteomonas sulcata, Strain CCMP704" /LENGTH=347 /DNA_ID=CAMNT_0026620725 /DNA_START=913 /DNA_END=1956 /DNA_ORIENTATION=+